MRIRPYFRARPRAGCIATASVVLLLLLLASARSLLGQEVTATAPLGRDSVAEVTVGNHTTRPLAVSLVLFRDGGAAVLGDTVAARISPSSFTLEPGAYQTVRIKVRAPVASGEVLRLATLFMPQDSTTSQTVALRIAMRIVSKVVSQ